MTSSVTNGGGGGDTSLNGIIIVITILIRGAAGFLSAGLFPASMGVVSDLLRRFCNGRDPSSGVRGLDGDRSATANLALTGPLAIADFDPTDRVFAGWLQFQPNRSALSEIERVGFARRGCQIGFVIPTIG